LRLVPVVCAEILAEYGEVMHRPRLRLPTIEVDALLSDLRSLALLVEVPAGPNDTKLPDVDDWPFIAAARTAGCPIVTGNARHFPAEAGVEAVGPGEFLARLMPAGA
jgi:predicted nucleic acid-binding protein